MKVLAKLMRGSVPRLIQLACFLALGGLAIMSFAIVSGRPLPVIFAMSFGHLVGLASIACFFLAVLIDGMGGALVVKSEASPTEPPAKPGE